MGIIINVIFLITFASCFFFSYGCQMEGVTMWLLPQSESMLDTFRGNVFNRSTSNIEGISSVSYGEGMNSGPYLEVSHSGSQFLMYTNNAYENYEENETEESMSVTVIFRCTGGTTSTLVFLINVNDTNNNAPQFKPNNQFEFTVAPPLPPGYLVTGCFNDITVRDIDLTTQRIEFKIEENPYFEIEYDGTGSTVAKEFKAHLRTLTFIRSLPEPITLRISATDVDLTDDPPITSNATFRITGDAEFEFPEEPVFNQAFYLANYTDDHQLFFYEPLSLQKGYDEFVVFSLEGEYSNNFELDLNGNQILLRVTTPLPATVLMELQIVLVVRANREYTSGDTTTVIIRLPEVIILKFERAYYEGSIVNNSLELSPMILSHGYEGASISAVVINEHSSYFSALVQGNSVTLTMTPLNENIIEENNFMTIQVVASTDRSSTTTIVTLEIIKDDNSTPVFDKSIYTGSYDPATGLIFEQIVFVQGYDETVEVYLQGEHASYFQIVQNEHIVTLTSSALSPDVFIEQNIILSIEATKPRTVGASAAVIIALPTARVLTFEASTYRGTLQDVLSLETIILSTGYGENINFNLTGDYASFFIVSNVQNRVTINVSTELPNNVIRDNNLVILTLSASGLNAVTTSTTVLLDIIKEDKMTPVFNQNIYYGTYIGSSNIDIENINLTQGFDASVSFRLEGDHSQYFEISNTENSVILSLQTAIPEDVIFSEKVLLFNILADKGLTVGANAAVLIRFPPEMVDTAVMRFSQNTYIGSLEENVMILEDIILNTGYATSTEFLLTGEYSHYFTLANTNNVVEIKMDNSLPILNVENDLIVLEVEARRQRAISVSVTVIIDIVKQEIIVPVFGEAYYRGFYTTESRLHFEEEINLKQGFDETVTFNLEGDSAVWFSLVQNNNSLTLISNISIPEAILEDENQLLFTVIATKPNNVSSRAAISIDLPKEDSVVLRFTQNNYIGLLHNGSLQSPTITLLSDYSETLSFNISGNYASYFELSQELNVVKVHKVNELPEEVIYDNAFLILDLEVSNPNAISGYTTIVIEIFKEPSPQILTPVFEKAYYVGEYSENTEFIFEHTIQLKQGYHESVIFTLAGENSQWFALTQSENSVTLRISSPIPAGILANNQHLIFVITASRTGSASEAKATIVISLNNSFTESMILGFDRVTYLGSIENDTATIQPITLSEGYEQNVVFTLHGEFANYFRLSVQGATVLVVLESVIPDQLIPTNRIIVLEIQASAPPAIPAYATIVFELVAQNDTSAIIELVFSETYYTGSYTEESGLVLENIITLTAGYGENVQFALVGDSSQWFALTQSENSVTLRISSPIPAGILANNQHLIFVITASRTGSASEAKATIVISLNNSFTESMILGFDRVTYLGSIENDTATIQPITLSEGYEQNVVFTLHGEFANYFRLSVQEATVLVVLESVIPDQLIPTNRIIVLEIQASAPPAIPAYATIVFELVAQNDTSAIIELVFSETYYTGSYTEESGLVLENVITLTAGYGENVQFALVGDSSQWFALTQSENSVTLRISSPIPAGILANNQHLIFVITASRTGSASEAKATIVISLNNSFTESMILGFDRVTYLGSIENDTATIQPITLSEGYEQNVVFTLHGEFANYFRLSVQEATVLVVLESVIPDQLIPTNRIIVLEIQASAPPAIPAYATIVFELVAQNDTSAIIELVFSETYYTGSYTEESGLVLENVITLTAGYGENVQFALVGDSSQWFALTQSENSVTLRISSPIPAGILANNQHLIFVITASRTGSASEAKATIVISLNNSFTESMILGFDRVTYLGSIENDTATIQPITLSEGYEQNVVFTLHGEFANYFRLSVQEATVLVVLESVIPDQLIPTNRIIVLEIQASAPPAIPAYATIVFELVAQNDTSAIIELVFSETYYTGSYTEESGLVLENVITLTAGYGENVQFALVGDSSQWFALTQSENSVTLRISSPIPAGILANNQQLIFVITASRTGSASEAKATIVISLNNSFTESMILGFDRVTYLGSIENDTATIQPITLSEGYEQNVVFTLHGEFANYFRLSVQGATVLVVLESVIPDQLIPTNRIIVLEIQASAPPAIPAYATIVFELVAQNDTSAIIELVFSETYYTGSYTEESGLVLENVITLTAGYGENVQFALVGDSSQWFALTQSENSVTLRISSPIPAGILANNQHLIFVITASRTGSASEAKATIVISLNNSFTESMILGFDRVTYLGSIENDTATIQPITLSEGYEQNVVFTLHGEFANYFRLSVQGATVLVVLESVIPDQLIPTNRIIVLEIQASAPPAIPAYATIVFELVAQNDTSAIIELVFSETYYTGSYTEESGLVLENVITLTAGYGEHVQFALEGDSSQWFALTQSENSVTLRISSPIPAGILANNQHLIFVITASRTGSASEARATIVISLTDDTQTEADVSFEKVIFEGIIQAGVVHHEDIIVYGFSGANIGINGEYASLFVADVSHGVVSVIASGAMTFPADVTHVVLELHAASARAVLLLKINNSDNPVLPVVTFSSQYYALRVEITQTGLVGQVLATADNGESLGYTLQLNNTHLLERLSISSEGELYLSAPANTGVYIFQVVATTIFTHVTGTATIHLSVEAITVCGDDLVVPPLIILDRDEEEAHYDLINGTQYDGCSFSLTNRWPIDQTWLYVDETGLHARSIDREHESIAFMALSQVQVELILHCDSDDVTRTKRSLRSERQDWLGPYDYATNKWILTDTILYNSRRSLVNLIVNDINDNAPIFVGKELEPIVVGYPMSELEDTVLPRSLVELQATDADIGENAALLYWSSEPELAVAPASGFVHVGDGFKLDNNARLRVNATDRNGKGLTGFIDIEVRLLNKNNIAVVTIRDAFLDNEKTFVNYLKSAIGYDIKPLRSVVISDDRESISKSRQGAAGASLQLYIYGLLEREPVTADKLIADINNNVISTVNIASTLSLADHLEGQEICVIPGRDTGLLAATIVLSILLFILLVLIAVRYFLKWRMNRIYQQFSDANSLASRNESLDQLPKPEVVIKPRLNIEELKKSERRLQEMLTNPIVMDNQTTSRKVPPLDAILDMAPPAPHAPIVIQSIDKLKDAVDESDDDEFGEKKAPRRKSVVTFNENVEKIIHVEDDEDVTEPPGYEIYKL